MEHITQEQLEEKAAALEVLTRFLPYTELKSLITGAVGEEADYYRELIVETAGKIKAMPVLYEQEEAGLEALVHLHYFYGGSNWYITEKDPGQPGETNPAQYRCFGYAQLEGFEGDEELGYISIVELVSLGAELDLYWEPKTLREVKEQCESKNL